MIVGIEFLIKSEKRTHPHVWEKCKRDIPVLVIFSNSPLHDLNQVFRIRSSIIKCEFFIIKFLM